MSGAGKDAAAEGSVAAEKVLREEFGRESGGVMTPLAGPAAPPAGPDAGHGTALVRAAEGRKGPEGAARQGRSGNDSSCVRVRE